MGEDLSAVDVAPAKVSCGKRLTRLQLISVMRQGRIVERGTHRELLERGGAYSRLYQSLGA